jgi:hypothetical protein
MTTKQDFDSNEYCRTNRILTRKQTMWVIAAVMAMMAGLLITLASANWSLRNQLAACESSHVQTQQDAGSQ